jgi:hypothetical protein
MADERQFALAWAKFDALYKNLPGAVTESLVRDLHQILDLLEKSTGEDLSSFRIPEEKVQPMLTSFNYRNGQENYSTTRYCERSYFVTQMDGVRGYFNNLQPPPKQVQFGF